MGQHLYLNRMTYSQFKVLVERLEDLAQQSPVQYRLRIIALIALAYLYLALLIGVVIASTFALVWAIQHARAHNALVLGIKLGIPLLGLNLVALRALWVRFNAPAGAAISAKEAPHLFAMLDKIRKRLRGPKIHRVSINQDFNASIVQIPQLGFFGWHRNYLQIGLPLMQSLTSSQLIAVIAHEYGHLAGAHGKFSAWVYRTRATWVQLVKGLGDSPYTRPIYAFWRWYGPYFAAYTFVLARADEYQADRAAADVVGTRVAAEALTRVHAVGDFIEQRFWPRLYERAGTHEKPPFMPFTQLPRALHAGFTPKEAQERLSVALAQETDIDDTHPSLSDRLSALNESAHAPTIGSDSAMALLGKFSNVLVKRLDLMWYRDVADSWREHYLAKQEERHELAALVRQAGQFELGADAAWRHAALTESFNGAAAARPLYESFLKRFPDHVEANFNLGRLLLAANEVHGTDHLNKAMQHDERYTPAACELIYGFLQRLGRAQDAALIYRRLRKYIERQEAAAEA